MKTYFTGRVLGFAIAFGAVIASAQPLAQSGSPSGTPDISGTWVAKMSGPMGEMEIVYKLKVTDGKITGTQSLPFGDSPIVDGKITGDTFHFIVELESFGDIQKREVTGKIDGDTLVLTPAMPRPPAGMAPGGPTPGPPGADMAGGPPSGPPAFQSRLVTARRGTPTPSFRSPSVDYAKLPRVALPALHPIPSNGLAKTRPWAGTVGTNSTLTSTTQQFAPLPMRWLRTE